MGFPMADEGTQWRRAHGIAQAARNEIARRVRERSPHLRVADYSPISDRLSMEFSVPTTSGKHRYVQVVSIFVVDERGWFVGVQSGRHCLWASGVREPADILHIADHIVPALRGEAF